MTSFLVKLIIFTSILTVFAVEGKLFSAHACEGLKMKLFCHNEEMIKVKSANYGRTNDSVCQVFEDAEKNVDCRTEGSIELVSQICDNKKRCVIEATNQIFGGDPCPGQVKYVEATYKCVTKKRKNQSFKQNSDDKEINPEDLMKILQNLDGQKGDEKQLKPEEALGLLSLFAKVSEQGDENYNNKDPFAWK